MKLNPSFVRRPHDLDRPEKARRRILAIFQSIAYIDAPRRAAAETACLSIVISPYLSGRARARARRAISSQSSLLLQKSSAWHCVAKAYDDTCSTTALQLASAKVQTCHKTGHQSKIKQMFFCRDSKFGIFA